MPTHEEKTRDFLAEVHLIDLKNVDFFLFEREEKSVGERDCLQNHCHFEMQGDKAVFGFYAGSAVPMRIRKQCFVKFDHYFPDGGIAGGIWGK